MSDEMMRAAQMATARAMGMEAVRIQAALKAHELLLDHALTAPWRDDNAPRPDPAEIAAEAVLHADALMRTLKLTR